MNELYTALIAAFVSIIGTTVTLISVRGNLKIKLNELKIRKDEIVLKQKDIENAAKNIESEFEKLKQMQLSEIIKKRLEVYPMLWEVLITYGTEWFFEGKQYNYEWAKNYLNALNACNKRCGVFFSQDVYLSFHVLRTSLSEIVKRFNANDYVTQEECESLYDIITDGTLNCAPLSTSLKDDLGSYSTSIIQMNT